MNRLPRKQQEVGGQNDEIPAVANGRGYEQGNGKQIGIELVQHDEEPRLRHHDHGRRLPAASAANGVEQVKHERRRWPCAADLPEHRRERAELERKSDERADERSGTRMPARKGPNPRRPIVVDIGQLMPDDAAQPIRERPDGHARHPRSARRALRASTGEEHRDERGKQLLAGGVAQDARCSTPLEPKRRKRIERERQPCGEVAQEESRVIAPEPGEEEARADGDSNERRDHGAGPASHAIPFPRRNVVGAVRDVVDDAGVDRGRHDREQQQQRARPQRAHRDVQNERGRVEGGKNRDELVLPPLVRADEADEIVVNETRIAQAVKYIIITQ